MRRNWLSVSFLFLRLSFCFDECLHVGREFTDLCAIQGVGLISNKYLSTDVRAHCIMLRSKCNSVFIPVYRVLLYIHIA